MGKLILCVDFDGVVHSYASGWQGVRELPDPPVPGAIAFLREALQHFDVQIFSTRSNGVGGIAAMKAWLKQHAGACWWESPEGPGLEAVTFPTEKPAAFLTLDDRAICFTGTWPSMAEMLAFKPWNRR